MRLAVRLTPNAKRNEVLGPIPDVDGRQALRMRIAAPPVEGAANKALTAFVAQSLDLRKADVSIRSGRTSRIKMLHLTGEPEIIAARLEAWINKATP